MKTLALLMALCIATGAYAFDRQELCSSNDTIVIIDEDENAYDSAFDEWTESDFNIDFPFMKRRSVYGRGRSAGVSFDIRCTMMLGFVGIVGGDNEAKFQMGRSIEFYMPNIFQFKVNTGANTPSIRLGAGFGLQHLFGKNGANFAMEEGDGGKQRLVTGAFPEGSSRASSKINRFAITIPLMIDQKIGRSGKITVGAMLDFNTHLGATSKYKIENAKHEFYYGDLAMRPITYEFIGAISKDSFGMYFKWSPANVFKKGCGPNTKNLSVGVVLGL